jgi:hypothetical protein
MADDVVFLVPGQRSGHTLSVLKKQNGAPESNAKGQRNAQSRRHQG